MAKFNYGGQAVVEGVMMRGRHSAAVAVRRPTGGILLHEEVLATALYRSPIVRWPFVRGLVLLWDMLILGTRMMMFATHVTFAEHTNVEVAPSQPRAFATASASAIPGNAPSENYEATTTPLPTDDVTESTGSLGVSDARLLGTILLSFAFAIGLFFLLPLGVVSLARPWLGDTWLSLTLEGLIRLALLVGYLALIGRVPDIQRVFQYHGAEHKAINTYESGDPLDVTHVRLASRVHTRCGTGFLLIVVVVSIVVFALLGNPPLPLRLLSRIVLVPVIAAIAYELLRLGAANYRFRVVRWLVAPSLALQGLTTREPDDSQIACAIAALQRVLLRDGEQATDRVV